ncbi:alpha/beta hydrolase [Sphingomonas panacis]|nr:lysophospholipase [Sphingomonas panacis]
MSGGADPRGVVMKDDVMGSRSRIVAIALAMALLPAMASAQDRGPTERVVDVPLAGGATQPALLLLPARPRGTIVMLPGGAGDVGLERDGDIRHGDNFVVRTRALWAARGYAVLIPDTVGRANLRGVRSSPSYARRVGDLVAFAHRHVSGPVFLLGTSQGSIAAMNGAAHAPAGSVAGVVLTESVSVMGGSGETVFDASPERVRVPALIVANRDDRCNVAPPGAAPKIAAAMTASRDVRVLMVAGGVTRSDKDCGSLTPHGYYGIEDAVVGKISGWIGRVVGDGGAGGDLPVAAG